MEEPKTIIKWKYRVCNPSQKKDMKAYQRYIEKQVKDRHDSKGDYQRINNLNSWQDLKPDQQQASDFQGYQRYIEYREGSGGLFSSADKTEDDIKELKRDMAEREGFFWIPIISMKEKDALAVGMDTEDKWIEATRQFMTGTAKILGVAPEQLNWVGAFHLKSPTDHVSPEAYEKSGCMPHCHLVIWSDPSLGLEKKISHKQMEQIRKLESDIWLAQYKKSLYAERNQAREELTHNASTVVLEQCAEEYQEYRYELSLVKHGGRLNAEQLSKEYRQMLGIVAKLEQGKELTQSQKNIMKYQHCKTLDDCKQRVARLESVNQKMEALVDHILNVPEMRETYESWMSITKKMRSGDFTANAEKLNEKDAQDLRKRIKNQVLNAIKEDFDQRKSFQVSDKLRDRFNNVLENCNIRNNVESKEAIESIRRIANMGHYLGTPPEELASQMIRASLGRTCPISEIDIRNTINDVYAQPNLLHYTSKEYWDAMHSFGYNRPKTITIKAFVQFQSKNAWNEYSRAFVKPLLIDEQKSATYSMLVADDVVKALQDVKQQYDDLDSQLSQRGTQRPRFETVEKSVGYTRDKQV